MFHAADGGTLFLDEIAELDVAHEADVLVLEDLADVGLRELVLARDGFDGGRADLDDVFAALLEADVDDALHAFDVFASYEEHAAT